MQDKYQAEAEQLANMTPNEIGRVWSRGASSSFLFGQVNPNTHGCLTQIKYGNWGLDCTTGDEQLDAIIRADERLPNPLANAVKTFDGYDTDTIGIDPESLPVFVELNRMIDEKFPHVRS
jgi:hypothetical protein